jgi:hypothetical protein
MVFINEAFLWGGILTRIFLWGKNILLIQRIFHLIFFPSFFVLLLALIVYYPYRSLAVYKKKNL